MDTNIERRKYFGFLVPSISKIQRDRVGELPLTLDAVQYLDKLLIGLLVSLLIPVPKSLQEAQDQITRKFPEPLSSDAVEDCRLKIKEKGKKKIHISVDKVHHIIKDISGSTPEKHVPHFFAAVLEYMLSDVLKLTSNYVHYVQNNSREEINEQDVKIAMYADKVLVSIFQGDDGDAEDDVPLLPVSAMDDNDNVSYDQLFKNLLSEEQRYLKDLQLIIKVFKKAFVEFPNLFSETDLDLIFYNIEDIAEMSAKLIVLLDEAKEVTDEKNPHPLVGYCFEELAEECSFELYSDYTLNITDENWEERFRAILQRTAVTSALENVKLDGFRNMVTYVLPNLLRGPIYHGLRYFDQIQAFQRITADDEDRESYSQTVSAISPIKILMDSRSQSLPKKRPSEVSLRFSWKGGLQAEKMKDIEDSIEGWIGKPITNVCNEFLFEGDLKQVVGKRNTVRRVFLFDFLLVCCKSNQARRNLPAVTTAHEYRLKQKIRLRIISVQDEADCQFSVIESADKEANKLTFIANTMEDKQAWMSHLVRLQHRSTYDRFLDQLLRKEIGDQPLRLPSPKDYRFAEPDSDKNLVLDKLGKPPMIKGGTVRKLVERLTYHEYGDNSFTKTFLTTFRSFCKPSLLLDLLIERFDIPEPPPTPDQQAAIDRGEIITRNDLKRFRHEYSEPIQLRVLNVLRKWVEFHWYDFEADPSIVVKAEAFLSSVKGKNRQKLVRTIQKLMSRGRMCEEDTPTFVFEHESPIVEWHTTHEREKFSITTLHPIEIARQLTLLEFELYRKVQPSELVGTVWTKSNKEESSPNLLRMIHCSTTITRWLCRSIVETKNFEERCAVMARAVEIMQVLKQLNNFNGMLEFVAAFNSAAIHRLNHTKQHLPDRLAKILQECMNLCDPRLTKTLEKLRSCNPPCVPFVGTFLTNILKTEEGNPHLLPNYPEELELINFGKRRMVASILFDIQQYQNQPYNLRLVPEIRTFLTNLQPFRGYDSEKQFNDYIFKCSLEIEPRHCEKPPRFPKILTEKEIKSPGIIPSKKNAKIIPRDESRLSLAERRNSAQEEESISDLAKTPTTPIKKEQTPPPMLPRLSNDVASIPASSNFFTFDMPENVQCQSVPLPVADKPPPLPPRDDVPLVPHYVETETEFFHNEDMLRFHQPMSYSYQTQQNVFNFNDFHYRLPHAEPASFGWHDFPYPMATERIVHPPAYHSNPSSSEDRAPPVPPRERILPQYAPAVPPRDPPQATTPPYDSYRYVPDPTRYSSSNRYLDTPPPIPRRQPSAQNF